MRLRLEKVVFDDNMIEISWKPIGEYNTELDAVLAMRAENQKLREAGDLKSRVHMTQIL